MKTPAQLVACAKRELTMRFNTYPKWVAAGRMTSADAEHEIECMKQIIAVLDRSRLLAEISEEMQLKMPLPFEEPPVTPSST